MRSRSAWLLLIIAMQLAISTPPLAGQAVTGLVVDDGGAPVRAALVLLIDSAGIRQGSALTDAAGAFRVWSRVDGRHLVQVDRVGFASTRSSPLQLVAGATVQLRLVANPTPMTLEGITVRGRSRCGTTQDGAATARLWEEARKALDAAHLASAARAVQYDYVSYRRELATGSLAIRSEQRTEESATVGSPFKSAPIDTLLEQGFVRPRGRDSVLWHAPDAEVLLTEGFRGTHCFQVVHHPDSTRLVGLRFRPTGNRRLPEVEGTLWLERASGMLRHLEYRYLNAGALARHPQVGGRVEFERLPSGYWLVRRWWIRMPAATPLEVFADAPGQSGAFRPGRLVTSLIEVGGEVLGAGGGRLAAVGGGRLTGVVWDSLRSQPLAGARVTAAGTAWTALSDSAGAFMLGPLPGGTYQLSFTHPVLTAAGAPAQTATVTVPTDTGRAVALSVPGPEATVRTHCGTLPAAQSLIVGYVAARGTPLVAAQVTVGWTGATPDWLMIDQPSLRTTTTSDGSFAICNVPQDKRLRLSVRWGDRVEIDRFVLRGTRVHFHRVDY